MANRHFTTTSCLMAAIMVLSFFLLSGSCKRPKEWYVDEGAVWHTTYRIVYHGSDRLSDSIVEVLNAVEQSLSPFKEHTLISRINRNETDSTDSLIKLAFSIAKHINRASEGRFDPTVAPLVNIWGFGTDTITRKQFETADAGSELAVPQAVIDSALSLVGIADCHITPDKRIRKKNAATSFNFSSITKGLGCDMVGLMLERNGVESYMVEIGGEIAARGRNSRGELWKIQIDRPEESTGTPTHHALEIIGLDNCAIASSGNYRNFHDTSRYGRVGHTIDPVTGMPAKGEVIASTVVAPTCGEADGWSTACMATPSAIKALEMINAEPRVEALLVVARGDSLATVATDGFPVSAIVK